MVTIHEMGVITNIYYYETDYWFIDKDLQDDNLDTRCHTPKLPEWQRNEIPEGVTDHSTQPGIY
jgi:hypothetical protein